MAPDANTRGGAQPAGGGGQPASQPRLPSMRVLWFGILAGPIAWSLHLNVSYFIASLPCNTTFGGSSIAGIPVVDVVLALVGLALALVILAAAHGAWEGRRAIAQIPSEGGTRTDRDVPDPWSRAGFMSLIGLTLSALFLVAILVASVTLFYLHPCTR